MHENVFVSLKFFFSFLSPVLPWRQKPTGGAGRGTARKWRGARGEFLRKKYCMMGYRRGSKKDIVEDE